MGKLETPKTDSSYDTGQLILHRVFGYRAVVLFPWKARVYDRDQNQNQTCNNLGDQTGHNLPPNASKEVRKRTHTFYQVLIDQRDFPFIVSYFGFHIPLFVLNKAFKSYWKNHDIFWIWKRLHWGAWSWFPEIRSKRNYSYILKVLCLYLLKKHTRPQPPTPNRRYLKKSEKAKFKTIFTGFFLCAWGVVYWKKGEQTTKLGSFNSR